MKFFNSLILFYYTKCNFCITKPTVNHTIKILQYRDYTKPTRFFNEESHAYNSIASTSASPVLLISLHMQSFFFFSTISMSLFISCLCPWYFTVMTNRKKKKGGVVFLCSWLNNMGQ